MVIKSHSLIDIKEILTQRSQSTKHGVATNEALFIRRLVTSSHN